MGYLTPTIRMLNTLTASKVSGTLELCIVYRLPTRTLLPGVEVMLFNLHSYVGTGHQGHEALHPAPSCLHLVMEVEMISKLRGYVKSVIDFSETGVREQKVVIDLILEQLESSLFREQSADITMNFIPRICGGIHASRCFVGDVPAEDSFDITSPFAFPGLPLGRSFGSNMLSATTQSTELFSQIEGDFVLRQNVTATSGFRPYKDPARSAILPSFHQRTPFCSDFSTTCCPP
ncbi:hypothetical protein FA13DRAFT_1440626 [Coprinellus micaceus]|uniref:Uncharacterized protein n=1 Tax=Coprinellus micaceus TaxID=71717 RepID=A0A4Y7TNF9_COPMI|nr:hypothetical protein FA13DRAFT_1440626 [Coprinellus micaceus]